MDKLVIEGSPYAGEYDCGDISEFIGTLNMGELHLIKTLTGLRAGELSDAFEAGDSDLGVGAAAVILTRSGKRVVPELLWQATKIRIELDESEEESEEDEPSPPDETPPPRPSGGGSGKRTSGSRRAKDPSPTGPQD